MVLQESRHANYEMTLPGVASEEQSIHQAADLTDFTIREQVLSRSTIATALSTRNNSTELVRTPAYTWTGPASRSNIEYRYRANYDSQQQRTSPICNLLYQPPVVSKRSEEIMYQIDRDSDGPYHKEAPPNMPPNVTMINTELLWSPVRCRIAERFILKRDAYEEMKKEHQILICRKAYKLRNLFRITSKSFFSGMRNEQKVTGTANTNVYTDSMRKNLEREQDILSVILSTSLSKKKIWKQYELVNIPISTNKINDQKDHGSLGFGASGEVKIARKISSKDGKFFAIKVFHDIPLDELSKLSDPSANDDEYENDTETISDSEFTGVSSENTKTQPLSRRIENRRLAKIRGLKRIHKEYTMCSILDNENIIETYELFYDKGNLYTVMEYCDFDLYALVASNELSYLEICCYFKQILYGVKYLHDIGVSHRDLKLDNCVVNKNGILKIIDFGSSTVFSSPYLEHREVIMRSHGIHGSNPYLAPEVIYFWNYDPRPADVWSIAVIFLCMITKRFPWREPRCSDLQFTQFIKFREPQLRITSRYLKRHVIISLLERTPFHNTQPDLRSFEEEMFYESEVARYEAYVNKNRGSMDPLAMVPEESHPILSRMLEISPACRATIDNILEDDWVSYIEVCSNRNKYSDHHHRMFRTTHTHTLLPPSGAHMSQLQ